METTMSKTNDTSKRPATLEDHHTLADSELNAVSGGSGNRPLNPDNIVANIGIAVDVPEPPSRLLHALRNWGTPTD
jgi:hypothetical protein